MFVYDEKNGDSWSGYYGSKPDLKMHITRIYNSFRATEALLFVIRVEYEKEKLENSSQQKVFQERKLEIFR